MPLGSLLEELLAEEVGDLVHHELVESCAAFRATQQLCEQVVDELALTARRLQLEDFFVNLVLEQLVSSFVLGEEVDLLDQICCRLFRRLQLLQMGKGLGKGQLEIVLVRRSVLG